MINISGVISNGESAASGQKMNWKGYGSIHHQVEFLKKTNPSFANQLINCKMATINIKLKNKLILKTWEYTFDKVYWLPNSNTWHEKLSFTPIILLYRQKQVHAWLYKAYKSPHKDNDFLAEVIAPYIENLATNDICEVKINETYFK
jgi:hypothetical protein